MYNEYKPPAKELDWYRGTVRLMPVDGSLMSTPLLSTKFYCPSPRSDLVPRPRLLEHLDSGLFKGSRFARRLTLVSAPAGYGKTTLISEWVEQGKKRLENGSQDSASTGVIKRPILPPDLFNRAAWLSLDEGDNDPARFLDYLITALRVIDESIGQTVFPLIQSPQPPDPNIVLTTLINEIASITTPIMLVIDDYHLIHTPSIHQQMSFLLDHLPDTFHLVILTREDPLLPVARLRASGKLLEIRQENLRFTVDETADLLQRVIGQSLTPSQVTALERRTEGWIAGLQLAVLSMRGREDLSTFIQAFTGSSRFILDYLIEEVFERQSPEVKDFLIQTSILERLCAPLCNAVVQVTISQAMLESIDQANLFIVPLDQTRVWYRYHNLFAELLRHRLRIMQPGLEADLHMRASTWYEGENSMSDAIRHSLAARDWQQAVVLINKSASDFLKRGEVLTVISWYRSLPKELVISNPQVCFEYIWPLLLAGEYGEAAPLLEQVEKAAKDNPNFLGEIYAAQAYLARSINKHERMIERSQLALKYLPRDSINSRGIVAMNLGIAYWHMGKMNETEEILAEALEASGTVGNHYAVLTAIIFLGRVLAVRGQLHEAEECFRDALQQWKDMPINALAQMDMATLYYEWNELDKSDLHLQKAIALAERSSNDEFLTGSWLLCSRVRIAQGNLVGAKEYLEKAWKLVKRGNISAHMIDRLHVAEVRLALQQGKQPEKRDLKLAENVECHPFYRFFGVTKALMLPEVQARVYLEELSQAARSNEWIYGLIAVLALQASFAMTQQDGMAYLAEALQLGENGGFIQSFLEAGEKLIPLLQRAAAQGISPDYVGKILTAMTERQNRVRTMPDSMVEALSERELEVLRLVTAGMSNREIANVLIISSGTAKTHVHNVCGKLGVRNRTEAAMKAKELGLV
jgi:LuxR family maltose regulon positive regulatory protein